MSNQVEILEVVSSEEINLFWQMYRDTFETVVLKSPCRQSMNEDEFREDMLDPSTVKMVIRDDDGAPEAMLLITNNFKKLTWIEPRYFQAKFPEAFADERIYYVIGLLVRPDRQSLRHVNSLLFQLARFISDRRAVLGADFSDDLVRRGHPRLIQRMIESAARARTHQFGAQTYWAYESINEDDCPD